MSRSKQTLDLATVPKSIDDLQRIAIKRTGSEGLPENEKFYLMRPGSTAFLPLMINPSLRYAGHSIMFGTSGPSLLQLSLAICMKLYEVERAVEYHREFAGKFLIDLPQGNFIVDLTVPV